MTKSQEDLLYLYNSGYRVSKSGEIKNPSGKILTGCVNRGYLQISTWKQGKARIGARVHRLQAYQKFGNSMFNEGILVRHLNGNPLDNSFDNIGIGTALDNYMDRPLIDRVNHIAILKKECKTANIRHADVDKIKRRHKETGSYKIVMDEFGIGSKGTLWHILNKR